MGDRDNMGVVCDNVVHLGMTILKGIHHIAIICSDYEQSKRFYTEILGFGIVREVYRESRKSFKLDLALNGNYIIELFSFPEPPPRPSTPEACGLRHLAFMVEDVNAAKKFFEQKGVVVEPIRIDEFTQKKFTFFADPDGLPIELYEAV
ncbi:MAG: SMU1112c/YaeR family gloxylase I-like metalloprotein [Agriterribacter sp.]